MYHARAPKHFLLHPLFPFRTLGSSLEPGVDVRGWQSCCSHTKALAGKVQESSSMVNVDIYHDIYIDRGNWYFSYTFIYLYLLHFPSLPYFLPTLLGWFIVSIFPRILMSHMAFLPSVVLISLSRLYPFSIPYCCSAVPCLSLSLLDFKSDRLCTLFVLPLILKIFIQLTSITCCLWFLFVSTL